MRAWFVGAKPNLNINGEYKMKNIDQKISVNKKHLSFLAACLCTTIFLNDSPSWGVEHERPDDLLGEQRPAQRRRIEADPQVVPANQGLAQRIANGGRRFINGVINLGWNTGNFDEAHELAAPRDGLGGGVVAHAEEERGEAENALGIPVAPPVMEYNEPMEAEGAVDVLITLPIVIDEEPIVAEEDPAAIAPNVGHGPVIAPIREQEADELVPDDVMGRNIQLWHLAHEHEILGQPDLANYFLHRAVGYQGEDLHLITTRLQTPNNELMQVENASPPMGQADLAPHSEGVERANIQQSNLQAPEEYDIQNNPPLRIQAPIERFPVATRSQEEEAFIGQQEIFFQRLVNEKNITIDNDRWAVSILLKADGDKTGIGGHNILAFIGKNQGEPYFWASDFNGNFEPANPLSVAWAGLCVSSNSRICTMDDDKIELINKLRGFASWDYRVWPVSKQRAQEIQEGIALEKRNPPHYNLMGLDTCAFMRKKSTYNCSSWAKKKVRKCGINPGTLFLDIFPRS